MNRKIFFLDCDGTILDAPRGMIEVSDKTKYTVRELMKNGHLVYIASGRCYRLIPDDIKSVNPTGFITSNGAYCNSGNQTIYSYEMKKESINAVTDFCNSHDGIYFLETQNYIYTPSLNSDLCKEFLTAWKCDKSAFVDNSNVNSYQMMMAAFKSDKDCNEFENELKNIVDIRKQYGFSSFDISDFGINKGYGVRKILEFYGIDKKDAYAFGDGLNDLELLSEVEESYCMTNGNEKLKEFAKHIAPDVLDEGFYKTIVSLGLIEPIE